MIDLLRKSSIALVVLGLALVAQIPHAAHVFDRAPYIGMIAQPVSVWYAWILAYAYAIALESATLMFVVHGHRNASYGFAVASFAVNLSYYAMHGVLLWAWVAFPAWLLSALLPIAIASYSHILTDAQDVSVGIPAWVHTIIDRLRPPVNDDMHVDALPIDHIVAQLADDSAHVSASTVSDSMQPLAQLDDIDQQIIDAVRNGNYTPYAISKVVSCSLTTLKRKKDGEHIGRIPQLVAAGILSNSSGADGSEYRLASG